jgi:hypothetical protein
MSIDRLNFDALSEADLIELLTAEVPEGLRTEYKRDTFGNTDRDNRTPVDAVASDVLQKFDADGVPPTAPASPKRARG